MGRRESSKLDDDYIFPLNYDELFKMCEKLYDSFDSFKDKHSTLKIKIASIKKVT